MKIIVQIDCGHSQDIKLNVTRLLWGCAAQRDKTVPGYYFPVLMVYEHIT
jgi:hypothetical protein